MHRLKDEVSDIKKILKKTSSTGRHIINTLSDYLSQGIVFTPAVVGFLVKENQVLLGQRKKVSLGLGQNLIAGVGGKTERGESAEEALVRELEEEIGVMVRAWQQIGRVRFVFPHKPVWNQAVQIYLVSEWENEAQETEVIKPMWFSKNKLPEDDMWPDNLLWVPKILAGKQVNKIFLYDTNGQIKEWKDE